MKELKYSRQREAILEELRKRHDHPTADLLYRSLRESFPRISLGTVYRNLDFLADTGQILRLEVSGYTKRYDANLMPHQHVRCTVCGRVADVFPPLPVPSSAGVFVPGFARILSARIEFDGICAECAAKGHGASCGAWEWLPEPQAEQASQSKECWHV